MITKLKKYRKGPNGRAFSFIIISALFLGAVSFLIISNLEINRKKTELIDQMEILRKKAQAYEEENEQLRVGLVQTESEVFWEERLYGQGYKKPGETVVVVLPPEEVKEPAEKEKNFSERIEKILNPVKNFFRDLSKNLWGFLTR